VFSRPTFQCLKGEYVVIPAQVKELLPPGQDFPVRAERNFRQLQCFPNNRQCLFSRIFIRTINVNTLPFRNIVQAVLAMVAFAARIYKASHCRKVAGLKFRTWLPVFFILPTIFVPGTTGTSYCAIHFLLHVNRSGKRHSREFLFQHRARCAPALNIQLL
jgi:hypothetical protein